MLKEEGILCYPQIKKKDEERINKRRKGLESQSRKERVGNKGETFFFFKEEILHKRCKPISLGYMRQPRLTGSNYQLNTDGFSFGKVL